MYMQKIKIFYIIDNKIFYFTNDIDIAEELQRLPSIWLYLSTW